MRQFIALVFLLIGIYSFCQINRVPMRVGNLFGLADSLGTLKTEPKFDVIDYEKYGELFFIGFYINSNTSTLIYKDKEVLKNTTYNDFSIQNELVVAVRYEILNNSSYHSERNFNEINHLYTLKGKPIISEDYAFINIEDNADGVEKSNEVLLLLGTKDKKYSLMLYDKKLGKITKSYFDKTVYCDVIRNVYDNPEDKSITYIYRDKTGKGKKINLIKESKGISHFKEEDFEIKTHRNDYDYGGGMDVEAPYERSQRKKVLANDSIILTWRKIEIKRDFYYKPKQREQITIREAKLDGEWSYLIKKNGKVGLREVSNDKIIFPTEFDEILIGEFAGHSSCYLLKKNSKYGASISGFGNDIEIKPIFDKLFLIEGINYFGKKSPLIKLFNDDGTFYAYAKSDGTIFAK